MRVQRAAKAGNADQGADQRPALDRHGSAAGATVKAAAPVTQRAFVSAPTRSSGLKRSRAMPRRRLQAERELTSLVLPAGASGVEVNPEPTTLDGSAAGQPRSSSPQPLRHPAR
jgi:hypothetical protein